ncbi:hypothetical protein AC626_12660 [Pseudoalteromonas rubra]|uniref:Dicarboxylate/amino acid:cation symporter n=1 Tax=Pseudoalteromonas rubra TaxID=43658 RepID=A0A0L0ERQ0_9GAMM|nr:hypothetical protein AC626_12660 [Pseudoalteromonas rubra]
MNKFVFYLHHLKSNWAIFIGAGAGIHIGLNEPQLIKVVSPLGQFYLDMLTMCVLPILLTAIALSIGRLLNQPDSQRFVSRLSWVFLGGIFAASATGTLFGLMFNPGSHLDTASLDAIGNVIQDLSAVDLAVDLNEAYQPPKESSLLQAFFFTLVPSNIFPHWPMAIPLRCCFSPFYSDLPSAPSNTLWQNTSVPRLRRFTQLLVNSYSG